MKRMTVRTEVAGLTALALAAGLAGPASAAHASAGPAADHAATVRAMEAAVRSGVPGVTATAGDRRGTWSATTGVGDLRTGEPRGGSDRYRVGSITKTFVSTVLLQLEAEGRSCHWTTRWTGGSRAWSAATATTAGR